MAVTQIFDMIEVIAGSSNARRNFLLLAGNVLLIIADVADVGV